MSEASSLHANYPSSLASRCALFYNATWALILNLLLLSYLVNLHTCEYKERMDLHLINVGPWIQEKDVHYFCPVDRTIRQDRYM